MTWMNLARPKRFEPLTCRFLIGTILALAVSISDADTTQGLEIIGERGGDRTRDQLIKSQLLYH